MSGASFTGINTRAGDLLTLKMKAANGNSIAMGTDIHKTHYCLRYDSVLNINDQGVSILE